MKHKSDVNDKIKEYGKMLKNKFRANRRIVVSARTMIHAKNLPKFLWAEAINTAVYLQNRVPSGTNSEKAPFEICYLFK